VGMDVDTTAEIFWFDCVFCAGVVGLICLLNAATGDAKLNLDIDYNPFDCDCRDYSIISKYRFYAFAHWLDRVNCDSPPELFNSKVCALHDSHQGQFKWASGEGHASNQTSPHWPQMTFLLIDIDIWDENLVIRPLCIRFMSKAEYLNI